LTGGDSITARFLHSEFFTFDPVAKFWLAVNHKPVVRDDSRGFWRRMRLIPFTPTFDLDATLSDERRAEGPGILAWAVRGCLDWQEKGLAAPRAVLAATAEYEQEEDQLASFLDEACNVGPLFDIAAAALYRHYCQWAEQHNFSQRERLTSTAFGRKMGERFNKVHARTGVIYKGVTPRGAA